MPKVTFLPDDKTVEVREGENLLRAAMAAEVHVTASCGGDGTCGKCRLVVESGEVRGGESSKLTEEQLAEGYVLGCLAEAYGDVVVRVPVESRPGRALQRERAAPTCGHLLSSDDFEERLPAWEVDPPVRKVALRMPPPDLSDNLSDVQRVRRTLATEHDIKPVRVRWPAVRKAAEAVRDGDWEATATLIEEGGPPAIIDIEPGNTTGAQYAVAVDVGTTTIVGQMVDLGKGEVVAQASEYNAQASVGEDVITRIIYASKGDGLVKLQRMAAQTISAVVERLCQKTGVAAETIVAYVTAGNTTMMHLLLGLSPKNIRSEPYIPAATFFPWIRAEELGLPGSPEARLYGFPCVASYVGGDITAGVLAAGVPWSEKLTLYIDVGTNGEIVLGNREWLIACSCSAGPAFEGGGVLHGMRASRGAIEQVRIDEATFEPMILSIGSVKPVGICGTGLIDTVAEMLLTGIVDRKGKFHHDLGTDRVREGEHGWEYLLTPAEDTGTGKDIVITEVDIDNLIRAKAAIFAGIGILIDSVDVKLDDIDEVLIAGAFGHYLEIEKVTTIGLLPELACDKFKFVGNGSLLGAHLAALSKDMLSRADEVAEKMTYLELSVNPGFMDKYVSGLFLPHTDLGLFPGVAERLGKTG